MQTPAFWSKKTLLSHALRPAGLITHVAGTLRRNLREPVKVGIPVVCVGNAVVGGSGKTPITIAIGQYLLSQGKKVHFLCYGYRGELTEHNVLKVEGHHTYHDVGDEAILLSKTAPTWAGRNRAHAAQLAEAAGADVLVMDDGFQYPGLHATHRILVFDGGYGIGNGFIMPAGPLRESVTSALRRAHYVIVLGEDRTGISATLKKQARVLNAQAQPTIKTLKGQKIVAFAGIGRPSKFFATIERLGGEIVSTHSFPDHHFYDHGELRKIVDEAEKTGAQIYTTTKDAVKIPSDMAKKITVMDIHVVFEDDRALAKILKPIV